MYGVNTHPRCVLSLVLAAPVLAQAERTLANVTPDGVFYQRTANAAPASPGAAADSVAGLRWTHPGGASITEKVAAGNHGTMAWLARTLNSARYTLMSTTEVQPPTFIHEMPATGAQWMLVKAADQAPFAVTAVTVGGTTTVEFWSCFSSTPIWSKPIAANVLIDISASGQFVAIGTSPTQNSAQVEIFDALGVGPGTPIATLTASTHGLRQMDLSDDGLTLLMATHNHNHVFDVLTQTQTFSDGSTVSHDAHAISRDGSAWGRAGFNPIKAWVKNGGVYNNVLTYSDTSLGFAVFTAAGISNDGTTFCAAGYDALNGALLRIHCWDLTPTGSTLLWSYVGNGTGSLQTTPQTVSISDDGSVIAVGTWGDAANASPEVMLFARNGTGTPIGFLDTPGSCFDLDLSGDGQFLVVGTKAVHANTFGNGGEGYSYDLGGQTLRLDGTSSIGRTVTLSTEGAQNDLVILGFAGGFGPPLTFPGIGGELLLDTNLVYASVFAGLVPASGVHTFPLALPSAPWLVGALIAGQALVGNSAFSFTNAVRMPITP